MEALTDPLYDVDEKVIELIDIMKKKRNKNASFNCMRDIPTSAREGQTKEKLSALRTIIDVVISDSLRKCAHLIKDTKKLCEDYESQAVLNKIWDKTDLLNTYAPLKLEVEKFDSPMKLDDETEDKEQEKQKLRETVLLLQTVVEDQSKKIKRERKSRLANKEKGSGTSEKHSDTRKEE